MLSARKKAAALFGASLLALGIFVTPAQGSEMNNNSTTAPRDKIVTIIEEIYSITPGDANSTLQAVPLVAELDTAVSSNPAVMDPLMRARVRNAYRHFGLIRLNQPNPAQIAIIRGGLNSLSGADRGERQLTRAVKATPTTSFLEVSPRRDWTQQQKRLYIQKVRLLAVENGLIPEQVKRVPARNSESITLFGILPPRDR